jgi:hypothetical protein
MLVSGVVAHLPRPRPPGATAVHRLGGGPGHRAKQDLEIRRAWHRSWARAEPLADDAAALSRAPPPASRKKTNRPDHDPTPMLLMLCTDRASVNGLTHAVSVPVLDASMHRTQRARRRARGCPDRSSWCGRG